MSSPASAGTVSRPPQSEPRRGLITEGEALVIALYFLVALASIALTRKASGSSLLWPAIAITAALLVRIPSVRWGRVFVGLLCGGTLVNVLGAHDAAIGSLTMAAVEIGRAHV